MPLNAFEIIVRAVNSAAISPPSGAEAEIGWTATALGPALLVAVAGLGPIVVAVDLNLVDDEVAVGGPDSGGTRRLFQGRVEGANNVLETVPRMIGAQADALGKADDSAAVAGGGG